MILISSCSSFCPIFLSQVLSWEWRCSWSSADRRCSNYIWVTTILLPTQVWLILEVWQYINSHLLRSYIIHLCILWGIARDINYYNCFKNHIEILRDHFVYGPNQWEMMLQYNAVSHCLDSYTKCSLCTRYLWQAAYISSSHNLRSWTDVVIDIWCMISYELVYVVPMCMHGNIPNISI